MVPRRPVSGGECRLAFCRILVDRAGPDLGREARAEHDPLVCARKRAVQPPGGRLEVASRPRAGHVAVFVGERSRAGDHQATEANSCQCRVSSCSWVCPTAGRLAALWNHVPHDGSRHTLRRRRRPAHRVSAVGERTAVPDRAGAHLQRRDRRNAVETVGQTDATLVEHHARHESAEAPGSTSCTGERWNKASTTNGALLRGGT